MRLRGRRILLATVAIGLAGGFFGEQALAVELPSPPVLEPAPSPVPTVDALEAPAVPPPASVAAPQEAVAGVEQVAQDVAEAAPAPPLPSVDAPATVSALADKAASAVVAAPERAASAPAAGRKTVESRPAVRRPKPSASREPRPARATGKTTARGDATRAVLASTRGVEPTKSLLPREVGAAASRPPHSFPGGAAGSALLPGASGGAPGLPSAAAVSTPAGVPPDAGTRLVPVSTLLRRTLVTFVLERPG
jgi:hypothetical protein